MLPMTTEKETLGLSGPLRPAVGNFYSHVKICCYRPVCSPTTAIGLVRAAVIFTAPPTGFVARRRTFGSALLENKSSAKGFSWFWMLSMNTFSPLVIVVGFFVVFLSLFFGLYALLTKGQRRTMREIRRAAAERGWRYRLRHWQGNPTAFRIDGSTPSGLTWTMKSSSTRGYDRGWLATLVLRFPMLGGEMDFAVLPREPGDSGAELLAHGVSQGSQQRVTSFSGAAADVVAFLRDAQDLPSGVAAFDAAYQVLALPQRVRQAPVEPALAKRMMDWPGDSIRPHSLLAWRDPFGLVLEARLPAPANWATVSYVLALGEDLCGRLPAPAVSPAPRTLVDRVIARIVR